MSSSETFKPDAPASKALISNPQNADNEISLSSKTPEKPRQLRGGARNCHVALSIGQIRRAAAKSLFKSPQKQRTDQIDSWPEETPTKKKKTRDPRPVKLPERYEILGEFFNCLDISIRRLRKKGLMSVFSNIGPAVEYLTERRFTCSNLAQMKFVFPEVIEIKKVLVLDDQTRTRKPDLHVTVNVRAVENDGRLKSEGGGSIMHLRRAFWQRLADISKSHPEDYEIPEETLPHPFNLAKQHTHSDKIKFSSSSSPGEVLTGVHTAEQQAVSGICLQDDEIPNETYLMHYNQSKEDLNFNMNETPKRSLSIKTSYEARKKQQPTIATYLSLSFQGHSSQKVTSEVQASNLSVPEPNLNAVCLIDETNTASSSCAQVHATPGPIENDDGLRRTSARIGSTAEKLASTSARLMTTTPALHPPKRHYMSPDDNSTSSPNKLVRRPQCSRSLKFDTPVKNKLFSPDYNSTSSPNKVVKHPPCLRSLKFNTAAENKLFKDEALLLDDVSSDSDIFDVLPEDLLQSIRDKERKAKEQNAAILQATRRQQMISCLPELFNMIRFLFQSMNSSFMKKEDLVDKIMFSHSDSVDEGEVEEQLKLLLELVPEWISEILASGRDFHLIKINKMSNPKSIHARLEQAK